MINSNIETSNKYIFKFWSPLALTWIMMSGEGPYIAAIIARMPDPKLNLAGYGVAYSIGLVIEAPIIMMMSASAALVKGWNSYTSLRNYMFFSNIILSLIIIFISLPGIFYPVATNILNLDPTTSGYTHLSVILLSPWPAAIGYRRFYQGILIKSGKTKYVAFSTIFRLIFMSVTAFILYKTGILNGAATGTLSLSAGVIAEAAVVRIMVSGSIKNLKETEDAELSFAEITKFYTPLALTPLISIGIYPSATFFMSRGIAPLESLAVMPVVNSLIFLFRSIGLSYQEVVIVILSKNPKNILKIKEFAVMLGVFCLIAMGAIAFTPVSDVWFEKVSGLSKNLSGFASLPTAIMFLLPASTVLLSFQRGMLVHLKQTSVISKGTLLEAVVTLTVLWGLINYGSLTGVASAASAFLLGRVFSTCFFHMNLKKLSL